MESEEVDIKLNTLINYFENTASVEESALINKLLEEPGNDFKYEKLFHYLWNKLDPNEQKTEADLAILLDKIHHSIHLRQSKKTKVNTPSSGRNPVMSANHVLRNLGRIAAIFLVPLLGYLSWELLSQRLWEKNQATMVYNEIKCPLGAQCEFELPD